jgi:hypothetical protein
VSEAEAVLETAGVWVIGVALETAGASEAEAVLETAGVWVIGVG